MGLWIFMEFVTSGDRGVITEWYDGLDIEAQEDFHARLERLANLQRHLWKRPLYASIKDGIGEIIFKANRIQYRPLGWFGPQQGQFTLLFPAEERNGRFVPDDAVKHATQRRTIILSDENKVRVRRYDF